MEKYKEILINALYTGGVGSFWGVSYYLYQVSKWTHFKWSLFIINIVLAFFIWYVIWQFLPSTEYNNWLLAISGFSSYPILDILERRGARIVLDKIAKWEK